MLEIEDLVRQIDPARGARVPSAGSPEAHRLYEQVTSRAKGSWSPPRARAVAVGALGVAGVATAVVAGAVLLGRPTTRLASAAIVLDRVAKVAAGQPATSPPPTGEYLYTGSVGFALASQLGNDGNGPGSSAPDGPSQTYSVVAPFTRQVWVAADGSGRLEQDYGAPTFLSPADRAAWVADGSPQSNGLPSVLQDINSAEAAGQLLPDLSGLPTDPTLLLADIEAGKMGNEGAPPGDAGAFQVVESLLQETDASPALRSALYQVAGEIPGVSLVGAVRDVVGRPGTAVAFTSNGVKDELIFDPTTSDLLGQETVVADAAQFCRLNVPVGTIIFSTSYVANGVVRSTTEAPAGPSVGTYHVAVPTGQAPTSEPAGSSGPASASCGATPQTTEPPVSTTTPRAP